MKRKRGRGKSKGTSFERLVCKRLSLWWSQGSSDSVFWRTAGSGARATVRSRKGKPSENQEGDIAAVEASGRALIETFSIEIKRGYNHTSAQDLIEKTPSKTQWAVWIRQARAGKQKNWMLILQRDRRSALLVTSSVGWKVLDREDSYRGSKMNLTVPGIKLVVVPLESFFDSVDAFLLKQFLQGVKK